MYHETAVLKQVGPANEYTEDSREAPLASLTQANCGNLSNLAKGCRRKQLSIYAWFDNNFNIVKSLDRYRFAVSSLRAAGVLNLKTPLIGKDSEKNGD